MTKKSDTDPNFPPESPAESDIDGLLADLGKPKPLDYKEKRSQSAGIDAAEYHAEPRPPPQRADHNTFPNAPVIVNQTDPGVAPPANPLNVTPEERKRLDEELDARRKARADREAETAPRRTDPPGVTSDPPMQSVVPRTVGALALLVVVAIVIGVAMKAKSGSTTDAASSTTVTASATHTTSALPVVSVQPTVTVTATIAPTTTATTTTHVVPTSTATAHPTTTHTSTVAPPTATATVTAPATTSTSTTAPPDLRGTN